MIEAIACGTPVLAFHRGSVSEIVDEGTTGSIVDTVDEAVTALLALDRRAVRRRFEERFSANCIAGNYVDIYQSLLTRSAHGDVDGRKIVMPTERHMGIPGRPGIALAGSAMRQSENGIADKRQ